MSASAREVYESPEPGPYLQSPVDDMESFYWVALWASLRNKTVSGDPTKEERKWRKGLRGNTLERTGVSHEVGGSDYSGQLHKFNPILRLMWPVLATWRDSLSDLRRDWKSHLDNPAEWCPDTNIFYFDLFAYKGVLAFMRALDKHIDAIRRNDGSQVSS